MKNLATWQHLFDRQHQLQQAQLSQVDEIERLYRACGKAMWEQGFENWGDFYPPKTTIEDDITTQSLFLLLSQEQDILGVIVLNEVQPEGFKTINWKYPSNKVLVVHRLAIAVHQQKKGYARQLMLFAEAYAKAANYDCIRLDAYSVNQRLLKFYEALGYQSTKEAISLGAKWKHPFVCFEKITQKAMP